VNRIVHLASMARFAMVPRASVHVTPITRTGFALPRVPKEVMEGIARASVTAKLIKRIVIQGREHVGAIRAGLGMTARNHVDQESMALTAVKIVSVPMGSNVEDMMGNVGVRQAGWDPSVLKVAPKVIMAKIVFNIANVIRVNSVIPFRDVSGLEFMMILIKQMKYQMKFPLSKEHQNPSHASVMSLLHKLER